MNKKYKIKYRVRPKRFYIQWHITERCNLACTHCYDEKKTKARENTLGEQKQILEMYVKQLRKWKIKQASIVFMGGEVFLRDDFFDLLDEVKKYPQINPVSISSNGVLIDRKMVKKLKKGGIKSVQISMEGRKRVNDKIRGNGSFEYAKNAINNLRKEKVNVSVSVTVSKENVKEVPWIIKLGKQLDVQGIGFRRITPLGNSEDAKKYLLSPTETRDFYRLLLKKEKRAKMSFANACEMGPVAIEKGGGRYCPVGYLGMVIMPNGDVYPCRRLPFYAGNILKEGLEGVYYHSEVFRALRDMRNVNAVCEKCNYFPSCRGGAKCITSAYYNNRDPFNPDPQCWEIFNKLPNKNLETKKARSLKRKNYDYDVTKEKFFEQK